MKKYLLSFLLLLGTGLLQATVFTSSDGQFTIELPAGWSVAQKPADGAVLSVVTKTARIDFKPVASCKTEACVEQKVRADLADVKKKKMQVVGNTYTGEEIKRIDFSTGEPFFYISFFTPKNDFSSGYFLIGSQAYSVLARDLSYAQTDLIFSFISPTLHTVAPVALEMDTTDERAYDIDATPAVLEENLPLAEPVAQTASATRSAAAKPLSYAHTLLTPNMPPYIQQLGRGFDVIVCLMFLYILLLAITLLLRLFIKPLQDNTQVNPNSPYPIKFRRLYGTPSLIFRARDNQGNILLSLSSRWDSLFLFGGIMLIVGAIWVVAFTGILENTQLISLSAMTYSTIYSAVSLIIPLGFVILICGILWSQLVLRQFALYDSRGQKAVYVMQRGFGLKAERYMAYFAKSKEVLLLERKRFALLRSWQILDKNRQIIAHIKEESLLFAIVRKFTGHLWGLLRASYVIKGPMESCGKIANSRAAFNQFICQMDKPQALSARDMLAVTLIIDIRDRDKWYPWF